MTRLVLQGVGLAIGLALWPIVLPVLVLILITRTLCHPHRSTMTQLHTRPTRPVAAPVKLPMTNYTVHYTVNGMRGSWLMAGYSKGQVLDSFNELLPQARVNLISREGDW